MADNESFLPDDAGTRSKELRPLELATAHDFSLVRTAIQDRADTLKALAKKASDEGYVREGRTIQGDAIRLREDILPQLEASAQGDLLDDDNDHILLGIEDRLKSLVHRYVRPSAGEEDNPEREFSEALALRIEAYGRKISERAFAAGVAYRESTAEHFAKHALEELGSGSVILT